MSVLYGKGKAHIVKVNYQEILMRILVFSYLSYDNSNYRGGGWIDSLANILSHSSKYKVGMAYLSENSSRTSWMKNGITYFPIYRHLSFWKKLYSQITGKPCMASEHNAVMDIINGFRPDIIQLFGLETSFGSILNSVTEIPVVVHVQGICLACCTKWFPMGISPMKIWWYHRLPDKIKFVTTSDFYRKFVALSKIERSNYAIYKYYLGRTDWDFDLTRMLAPDSKYYFCNEVLRAEFYDGNWKPYCGGKVVLTTVTNGEIYKGFDTILHTAALLKEGGVSFEWNVYGVNECFGVKKAIEHSIGKRFFECNVYFRGKKSAKDLVGILELTTFYVHPSHIDNSPNALCEAMLVGVPCIASYVGGISSLIDNKVSGFLIGDGDAYHFASVIMRLSNDYDSLMKISQNAKKVAMKRHDKLSILENLNNIYADILKK